MMQSDSGFTLLSYIARHHALATDDKATLALRDKTNADFDSRHVQAHDPAEESVRSVATSVTAG
jgi:hypothetical protein